MIKFFRKIRRKLLKENRFNKYLLYAIGEIILVIIGILIALQINNWNENRKIKKELQSSLYGILEELNENINYISAERKSYETKIEDLDIILNKKAKDQDLEIILDYFSEINSKPFSTIYTSLKEDKRIQLISQKQLRRELTNFYEYSLPKLYELSKWHKGFVSNNIDPYILDNLPIRNRKVDAEIVKKLLKEIKFNNILSYQKAIYIGYSNGSDFCLKEAKELLSNIKLYLEQNNQ